MMKKKYIAPAEKHVDLSMEESLLIVVSDGTPAVVNDGILEMDIKEDKTYSGKNLWDELW